MTNVTLYLMLTMLGVEFPLPIAVIPTIPICKIVKASLQETHPNGYSYGFYGDIRYKCSRRVLPIPPNPEVE